jgi:exosortase/archaeosortase family protein
MRRYLIASAIYNFLNSVLARIFIRYIFLLTLVFIVTLRSENFFFYITVYPALFLLKFFLNNVSLYGKTLVINFDAAIEVVPACLGVSAYILLLILNLTTPLTIKKRICSLLFSFLILLLFNIIRITFFSALVYYNKYFFDLTHKIFWYILSTFFVIAIWFLTVKLFKINETPICSDLNIIKEIKKL